VEVEDRLTAALADVDDDAIVVETRVLGGLRDELEHALRLLRRKLADLAEGRNVPFRDDEQMDVGARVDVANRNEAVGGCDVLAFGEELAEEAVLRQRGSLPP
jgi:hypothetical protein